MSARPVESARRKGKGFKKGIDQDEARRKREDNIIQLRQNKRDENLMKRRTVGATDATPAGAGMSVTSGGGQSMAQKVCTTRWPKKWEPRPGYHCLSFHKSSLNLHW